MFESPALLIRGPRAAQIRGHAAGRGRGRRVQPPGAQRARLPGVARRHGRAGPGPQCAGAPAAARRGSGLQTVCGTTPCCSLTCMPGPAGAQPAAGARSRSAQRARALVGRERSPGARWARNGCGRRPPPGALSLGAAAGRRRPRGAASRRAAAVSSPWCRPRRWRLWCARAAATRPRSGRPTRASGCSTSWRRCASCASRVRRPPAPPAGPHGVHFRTRRLTRQEARCSHSASQHCAAGRAPPPDSGNRDWPRVRGTRAAAAELTHADAARRPAHAWRRPARAAHSPLTCTWVSECCC